MTGGEAGCEDLTTSIMPVIVRRESPAARQRRTVGEQYSQAPQKRSHKLRWAVFIIGLLGLVGGTGSDKFLGLALAVGAWTPAIVRQVRKRRYFASEEFLARKAEIASVVSEHNELAEYITEIRSRGSFSVGQSMKHDAPCSTVMGATVSWTVIHETPQAWWLSPASREELDTVWE